MYHGHQAEYIKGPWIPLFQLHFTVYTVCISRIFFSLSKIFNFWIFFNTAVYMQENVLVYRIQNVNILISHFKIEILSQCEGMSFNSGKDKQDQNLRQKGLWIWVSKWWHLFEISLQLGNRWSKSKPATTLDVHLTNINSTIEWHSWVKWRIKEPGPLKV